MTKEQLIKKRNLVLFLIAIPAAFQSCAAKPEEDSPASAIEANQPAVTAPETVEETEDLPPIPEGYDFGGYEFTLLNGSMADLPFFDLDDLYYFDRFEAISALLSLDGFKAGFGTAGSHGGLDYFIAGQTLFFSESLGNSHSLRNIIFNSLSYPSQVAFNQCDTQVTDLIWGGKTDFASYFAKWSKAIQKEIDKAIRSYEENN